jgi:hypothetical protein
LRSSLHRLPNSKATASNKLISSSDSSSK